MSYINKLHISHEVVENYERAQTLSRAFSSTNRYRYKADAILAGYAPLEPYMPIYIEGITNGFSGTWVVIAVTHRFNVGIPYSMNVHLGTNDQLLQLPKPVNSRHISFSTDVIRPHIYKESDALFSNNQEKTGEYYFEQDNAIPINTTNELIKPVGYDPVSTYLSTNVSSDPNTLYTVYNPSVYLEKKASWKRRG